MKYNTRDKQHDGWTKPKRIHCQIECDLKKKKKKTMNRMYIKLTHLSMNFSIYEDYIV